MGKLEGFALRLPPSSKAAAVALSKVSMVYEIVEKDGKTYYNNAHITGRSINDVLNSLILRGIESASDAVEKYLHHQIIESVPWKEIVKFFLDNPAASHVLSVNFIPDFAGRKLIDHLTDTQPDDFPDGIDRTTAMEELASRESEIWKLTEALGALQRAQAH